MSVRTVFQYVLLGLVVASSPGFSAAQPTPANQPVGTPGPVDGPARLETAPMPHTKDPCHFGGFLLKSVEYASPVGDIAPPVFVPAVGMMVQPNFPPPPRCAFESQNYFGPIYSGAAPMPLLANGGVVRVQATDSCQADGLPPLPRNPVERFGELSTEESRDGRPIITLKVLGMRRIDGQYPYPCLVQGAVGAVPCDQPGAGWWVETVRVPQPRLEAGPGIPPGKTLFWTIAPPLTQENNSCRTGAPSTIPASRTSCSGLAGTWYRQLENALITATMRGDELKICMSLQADEEGPSLQITLTADYAISRDNLVHGVITGVDMDVNMNKKGDNKKSDGSASNEPAIADAQLSMKLQSLVDCPFSFRMRMTSAGLMVSSVRMAPAYEMEMREIREPLLLLGGMYKSAKDGKVPAWKPKNVSMENYSGMTLPSPRYLEHYPQYFPPGVPTARVTDAFPASGAAPSGAGPLTGGAVGAGAGALSIAAPSGAGPLTGGAVGAGAGALVNAASEQTPSSIPPMVPPTNPFPPAPCPRQCEARPTATPMSVNSLPTLPPHDAGFAERDFQIEFAPKQPANVPAAAFEAIAGAFDQMLSAQDKTPPQRCVGSSITRPASAACSMPAQPCSTPQPLAGGTIGTWVRTVGPMVHVLKIDSDHFTLTTSAAIQCNDDKVVTQRTIITADYHMMLNSATMVGLITGVDVQVEGELPPDSGVENLGAMLSQLQKAVADMPFALSLRLYSDALVIGNARLPEGENPEALLGLGGRFTAAGDKPIPAPKAMKTWPNAQPTPMLGVQLDGQIPAGPMGLPPGVVVMPPTATLNPMAMPAILPCVPAGYGSSPMPAYPPSLGAYVMPQYQPVSPTYSPGSQATPELSVPMSMPSVKAAGPIEPPVTEKKSKKKAKQEETKPSNPIPNGTPVAPAIPAGR